MSNTTSVPNTTTSTDKELGTKDWPRGPVPGVDPSEYNCDRAIVKLCNEESFLGLLFMTMPKIPDWNCPTAYVRIDPVSFTFFIGYNPEFMRQQTLEQKVGLFKHEIYHTILGHLTSRKVTFPAHRPHANIAMDLAINSLIGKDNLPAVGLFPGHRPLQCQDEKLAELIASLPEMQSTEFYLDKLLRFSEQNENGTGAVIALGGDGMDSHDWDSVDPEIEEIMEQRLGELIDKGIQRATVTTNGWGTVPQALQQEILKSRQPKEVDWRSVLRLFLAKIASRETETTIRKLNKRLPYVLPGSKRKTTSSLAFFIDQSGSMSDKDVARCFAEVEQCSNLAEIDVFNFDTEIDETSHKVWKKNNKFPWSRTRSGGTNFQAVANFVNEQRNRGRWTGVIILTDGYAPTMGVVNGARVLWIVTPEGTKEYVRPGDLCVKIGQGERIERK